MALRQSILNQTDNSLKLGRPLLSKDSNLVFSPLSIHVLLGMIAAGSNAPTRDQIIGLVTSSSSDDLTDFISQVVGPVLADGTRAGGPVLSTANGLWVDWSLNLKPAFRDLLRAVYKAASERVDFLNKPEEVRKEVNTWGSKETKGLIKDILAPGSVNATTQLILANAVYFKGNWSQNFDESLTEDGDFHLLNGSSVRAPMMSNYKRHYYSAFDGFKVLKLPYKQGNDSRRFSMYIYLPDSIDGLPSLRERLCSESGFINSHLAYTSVRLEKFLIPKFKIAYDFEASNVLKKLGLVLPFEGGGGGGLTEMVDNSLFPLEVSRIFHKAFIEVNEEGTRAAAVSVCIPAPGCAMNVKIERLEFVADHPFMFVIREDNTGLLLFIGQLLNPLH